MLLTIRPTLAALLAAALLLPGSLTAQVDPIQLQVVEGQAATNSIETGEAVEPVVEVRDAQGRPVSGLKVTFRSPKAGPSVLFYGATREVSVVSDANGRAVATKTTPNTEPGQFAIAVEAGAATIDVNQSNAYTQTQPEPKKKKLGPKMIGLIVAGVVVAIAAIATGGD
jgi:hypothetical protein